MQIGSLLETIQKDLFEKAKAKRDSKLVKVSNWEQFMEALHNKCICLAPWCEQDKCEKSVNERSKKDSEEAKEQFGDEILTGEAKTLCIPLEQELLAEGTKCFACGEKATATALWGRSY